MPAIKPSSPPSPLEPISIGPETAARLSGLSVRTIYRLLEAKAFIARRSESGARTLIDFPSLKTYLTKLPEYIPGASMPNAPHVISGKRRKVRR